MNTPLDRTVAKAAVAGADRVVFGGEGPVVAWADGDPFALDESAAEVSASLLGSSGPSGNPQSEGAVRLKAAGLEVSASSELGVWTLRILWPRGFDPDDPLSALPPEKAAALRSAASEPPAPRARPRFPKHPRPDASPLWI